MTRTDIVPSGFSDHSLVKLCLSLPGFKHRTLYCCFNTPLLSDPFFKSSFKVFWERVVYLQHQFLNLFQWWDYAKAQIRVFCQQYKINCSRSKQLCIDALKQEILRLHYYREGLRTSVMIKGVNSSMKNKLCLRN